MRRIIAGITVNAYESRAQCERSGSIRQRREKYRFEEERNGRRDYGEQEGAAPEENRIAEEYGGRYEAMRRCIVLMLGKS